MSSAGKTSYVCSVDDAQRGAVEEYLKGRGWIFGAAPYAHWKASGDKVNVVAYHSGKLTVQGGGTEDFVLYFLEPEVLKSFGFGYAAAEDAPRAAVAVTPHGGVDESGKGDFFGPLVIAGVYVDAESAARLAELGCRDSKTIKSDAKIAGIARGVRQAIPGCFTEVTVKPVTYNQLYAKIGNLNRLLAWGHARVIENLLELIPECPRILSDQFADEAVLRRALLPRGKVVKLDLEVRAESDIAVAAASLLASDGFVRGMTRLSQEAGVTLKRGAGAAVLAQAKELFDRGGDELLAGCAKTHFKTWYEATGRPVPERPEYSFRRSER